MNQVIKGAIYVRCSFPAIAINVRLQIYDYDCSRELLAIPPLRQDFYKEMVAFWMNYINAFKRRETNKKVFKQKHD